MPELPEVETLKRQLEKKVKGKIIKDVDILSPKNFIGKKEEIIGKKIEEVDRFGKVLSLKLVDIKNKNSVFLNIHLKLTGELLYANDVSMQFLKKLFLLPKLTKCQQVLQEL
jgi:formamidopyrimidine-DNA glycosylase